MTSQFPYWPLGSRRVLAALQKVLKVELMIEPQPIGRWEELWPEPIPANYLLKEKNTYISFLLGFKQDPESHNLILKMSKIQYLFVNMATWENRSLVFITILCHL